MKCFTLTCTALLLALCGMVACSSTNLGPENDISSRQITETRVINKQFKAVSNANGIATTYVVEPGARQTTVKLEGPENLLRRIKTEVSKKGILEIETVDGWGLNPGSAPKPKVTVTGPEFSGFEGSSGSTFILKGDMVTGKNFDFKMSSGGTFNATSALKCANLYIDISSGATIGANSLSAKDIKITASSGGVVTLGGTAQSIDVDANSGAVISLEKVAINGQRNLSTSSGAIIKTK